MRRQPARGRRSDPGTGVWYNLGHGLALNSKAGLARECHVTAWVDCIKGVLQLTFLAHEHLSFGGRLSALYTGGI